MSDHSRRPASDDDIVEPSGGPRDRERQFLEERFATLRPKEAEAEEEPGAEEDAAGEAFAAPVEEPPMPAEYRQDLIKQYRERQQQQLEETGRVAGPTEAVEPEGRRGRRRRATRAERAEDDDDTTPEPPQPPQPPPAGNWIPIGPSIVRQGQISDNQGVSGRVAGVAIGISAGTTVSMPRRPTAVSGARTTRASPGARRWTPGT